MTDGLKSLKPGYSVSGRPFINGTKVTNKATLHTFFSRGDTQNTFGSYIFFEKKTCIVVLPQTKPYSAKTVDTVFLFSKKLQVNFTKKEILITINEDK